MYETKTIRETGRELDTDPDKGLSLEEAEKRREKYGRNELAEPPGRTYPAMFLEQLNDPLIFILFVAAAVSMLLGEFGDTAIILVVIIMNALVGVIQEGKAQKALEALKKMTSLSAFVKRGGEYREIHAAELVPGDLVILEAGCQVPADLRLSASSSLKVEEAALTGESVPVEKDANFIASGEIPLGDRKNMAYMSTNVVYGRGEGIVTATGMQTQIGRIADMINETETEMTPLQKRLGGIGKILSMIAVILCAALFVIAVIQKRNIPEMLITAISLAVAAVPEGLPAVVTIVLALSVTRMVKVNTIVRRLPAVETLGSVNVVCSDKTGTLTQNKMTVMECYMDGMSFDADRLEAARHKRLLEGFVLCNDAVYSEGKYIGDPTETALLAMGAKAGAEKKKLEAMKKRTGELPFDSDRKMMTTVHREGSSYIAYTKGSCDEILKRCTHILRGDRAEPITGADVKRAEQAMERMSSKALRVLGLAMKRVTGKPEEKSLTFIGMAGMIDPPREEAKEAISLFRGAGVDTVMITGDHVDTAFAIASRLGITESFQECVTGKQLDRMDDKTLSEKIGRLHVFARVSPQHKVRIVKAFKQQGKIVAMTGDGVNDAPSLKAADIGIAMGKNGTDVAKNASDIILTDDNFATIERAIEEGRGIYENIRKSVLFLLSSNFGEIITMFLSILAGLASPLKASHILWVNLMTDSLPALALGVDENDRKQLMEMPPRDAKESLFADGGMFCTLFYGSLIAGVSLLAFLTVPYDLLKINGMPFTLDTVRRVLANAELLARAQTYAFTVLGLSELFHAIGMRNVRRSVFRMKHLHNRLMIAAFAVGIGLQFMVTEIPYLINLFGTVRLSLPEWGRLTFLAAMPLLAHEMLLFDPGALFGHSDGKRKSAVTAENT